MIGFLVLLLVIWLACIVVGIAIKGLFWLIIVGVILLVVTAAWGFIKREALSRKR